MVTGALSRRSFIKQSVGAAVAAGLVGSARPAGVRAAEPASQPAGRTHPLRLGGRIFLKDGDPEAMALAHRQLGYRAAYCPAVNLKDSDRIQAISKAFARHDVLIAEVGRWCNLLEADPTKRAQNLKAVTEGLALAEAIGALCCVDIAGTYSTEFWFGPHPDNFSQRFFDESVENARRIIDAVKPKRAKFCFEMMGWAPPDSPDAYLRLIKAVDREAFGVHLDVCNLVNSPYRFYRNTELINECFDKLGRWIVSCHAKDLTWDVEMNVHFREVPAGAGKIDYPTYLRRLASLDHDVPLMIEHCGKPKDCDRARQYILNQGAQLGLSFS